MQASHAPVVDLDLRSFAKNDTAILGSIKITLSPAETLALVGPSGIGKTSLLRIIAGIETGFEGDRRVHGKIAMVFQELMAALNPLRRVGDTVMLSMPESSVMWPLTVSWGTLASLASLLSTLS